MSNCDWRLRRGLFGRACLVLSSVLACAILGCGPNGGQAVVDEHAGEELDTHAEDIVLTSEAIKIAGIEFEEARRMPMQGEVSVPGVVTNTARGKAIVTSPVAGKITRLLVGPGDRVTAGQPVAMLQSFDLAGAAAVVAEAQRGLASDEAGVREANSEIELASGRLGAAQATLKRQLQLARTGAFSQPSLQEARRALSEAEAELEEAEQNRAVHQTQLERAERLFQQELVSRTELEEARLAVRQDRIRQERASREIALAKATFEREQKIAEGGLLNSREIQVAEAEVRAATLELKQSKIRRSAAVAAVTGARKAVQTAQASYSAMAGGGRASGSNTTVVAPIGGVITHREVSLGQAIERTTEICEIENLRSVWVTAQVPEKDIAKVTKGSRAQIAVKAFPNRSFYGIVQVVGSRLDPKSRTMPVQVLVENNNGDLKADMFATAAIGFGKSHSAIAVKKTAVLEDGDKRLIYVAEDGGKFEERMVELGRRKGDYIEVLSGLTLGEKVVVKGAFVLKSEKVKSELKGHDH